MKKLSVTTYNALVRITSKKQNKVRKLNSGQRREEIRINLEAIAELPAARYDEVLSHVMRLRQQFLNGEKNG